MADVATTRFERRHWTTNECRYVQRLAAGQRLKFRLALAVIVLCWLGIVGGFLFFVYSLIVERSVFSGVAAVVALSVIVLLAGYVFPRYWRACVLAQDSPWVEPMQGKLGVLELSGYDGVETYDAVGGREVRFPPGWLRHLQQGDELRALRYAMEVELDRTSIISVILALDNGFSIDEEVELGLLDVRSPTYWLVTVVASVLWRLAPSIAALFSLKSPPVWIPPAIVAACTLLAVRRTVLDVAIRRKLTALRQQHAPLRP